MSQRVEYVGTDVHIVGPRDGPELDHFLTSDGEKPDRDRDGEFELGAGDTRGRLLDDWGAAWGLLLSTVEGVRPEDVQRSVYIRGEAHTVSQALQRTLGHLAYHVGQIVLLAKHWAGGDWRTLTIPRGQSKTFMQATTKGSRT